MIHKSLSRAFLCSSRHQLTNALAAPLSPDFFLRRVLIPELALRLVGEDLGLDPSDRTVRRTLEASRAYGCAMFPADEPTFESSEDEGVSESKSKPNNPIGALKRRRSSQRSEVSDIEVLPTIKSQKKTDKAKASGLKSGRKIQKVPTQSSDDEAMIMGHPSKHIQQQCLPNQSCDVQSGSTSYNSLKKANVDSPEKITLSKKGKSRQIRDPSPKRVNGGRDVDVLLPKKSRLLVNKIAGRDLPETSQEPPIKDLLLSQKRFYPITENKGDSNLRKLSPASTSTTEGGMTEEKMELLKGMSFKKTSHSKLTVETKDLAESSSTSSRFSSKEPLPGSSVSLKSSRISGSSTRDITFHPQTQHKSIKTFPSGRNRGAWMSGSADFDSPSNHFRPESSKKMKTKKYAPMIPVRAPSEAYRNPRSHKPKTDADGWSRNI